MATKIYNDPWSPSNINCNWKPEKLSRYSFITNMINFNAAGVLLGYSLINANIYEEPNCNLTDYIEVTSYTSYKFICEQNVSLGVRCVTYFNSNKNIIGYDYYSDKGGISWSLNGEFRTPSNCRYIRMTLWKQAWEKCSLRLKYFSLGTKDMTPLNIVDNKAGEKIYEDLHFEVYVKAESLIKNFVDCFSLKAFQRFPNEGSYWNEPTNSVLFQAYTYPWYKTNYSFDNFISNHGYQEGDKVKGTYVDYFSEDYYLVCKVAHISADTFNHEINTNLDYWISVGNKDSYWLQIDKNIKESNYNLEIGFPYVGSLLFKNLWGCDITNYLSTFVNKANLALYYYKFFAENLRKESVYYDKFFDEGYFEAASHYNSTSYEGFGIRLIRGESFRNDELLGDFVANNYFGYSESNHNIQENWDYSTDNTVKNYFGGNLSSPFDHFYQFSPKIGIPFFKEKEFNDFKIELVLQKKDILGNIFQRIIDLPILVNFYNNLIKVYFTNNPSDGVSHYYDNEYLNSNQEHNYSVPVTSDETHVCNDHFTVWCPDVEKLFYSTTIIGSRNVSERPIIVTKNGQLCVIRWKFEYTEANIGEVMRAVHVLEYSDGENYDKFIYIENITIIDGRS